MIHLDDSGAQSFLEQGALDHIEPSVLAAHQALLDGTGKGSEFLGWRSILERPDENLLAAIEDIADEVRQRADVLLCIGIGGSYLGARAIIDSLTPYFDKGGTQVLFAGHQMSGSYLTDLLAHLEGKSVYVNVISKSGTTLEPALAFRFVRAWMSRHFDDAERRIIATTDPERGALNRMIDTFGYRKFEIPENVGGRFSVLTPVGLLPIAVSGVDMRALFFGAVNGHRSVRPELSDPTLRYAGTRFLLHKAGYSSELLAVFEPRLSAIASWWQQLYGESEGKEHRGLLPVAVQYSTDLHSLGQYVQDGMRNLLETFLVVDEEDDSPVVPHDEQNHDGLNYLAGRSMATINRQAYEGTLRAHRDGGVPVMTLSIPRLDAALLGALVYHFQHAVSVSGYLLGVNPFDQPGVEAYKKEMFRMLGRP